ncbi:hypothetical protein NC651_028162 [Populus alba x Populus x berolinensis]|nr:hypothetical protein NC651_028162 [Populus alba x Populus x berolinensis]
MGKKKQLSGSLSHGRLQCYNILLNLLTARSLSEKLKHCKKALFTSRLLKQGKPLECKLCKPGGVLATVSSRHRGFGVFIFNEINLALLLDIAAP